MVTRSRSTHLASSARPASPVDPVRPAHRPWPLLAAVSLALLLPLGACSGPVEDGSGPSSAGTPTTTSPTASSAPTPTPTPVYKPADANGPAQNVPKPVKPALADEFSKAGVEAFAKYWYSTLDYAYESGDTGPMDAITDSSCDTCSKARSTIQSWYADRGWILGGHFRVSATQSTFAPTSEGLYQTITQLKQSSSTFYKINGTVGGTTPDSPLLGDIVETRYEADHWVAHTVGHIAKGQ